MVLDDISRREKILSCCRIHCLQIVNSTMLSLNVGEQSSVKRAVTVLATIAPGEAYSMPVLRKEPGLICFRPAGDCFSSPTFPCCMLRPALC